MFIIYNMENYNKSQIDEETFKYTLNGKNVTYFYQGDQPSEEDFVKKYDAVTLTKHDGSTLQAKIVSPPDVVSPGARITYHVDMGSKRPDEDFILINDETSDLINNDHYKMKETMPGTTQSSITRIEKVKKTGWGFFSGGKRKKSRRQNQTKNKRKKNKKRKSTRKKKRTIKNKRSKK
jgi:hypothetical protein